MRTIVALAVLGLLLATPAQGAAVTGPTFYLQADGRLTTEAGGPATTCVALAPTSTGGAGKTFEVDLSSGPVSRPAQTLAVWLALAANPSAGTGITIQGDLRLGDSAATDAVRIPTGAAIVSPLRLAFALDEAANGTGKLVLDLQLLRDGAGPLAAGQSLGVLCGDAGSRIDAFVYDEGAPSTPNGQQPGAGEGGTGLSTWEILAIAIGAGLVTLAAGALAIAGRTVSARRIHLLLGATAGLLIAIAVLDLIPEAVELDANAPFTIIGGLLVLFLVRHFAGDHGHDHAGDGHEAHDGHRHANREEGHAHHVATHAAGLALITFFALGFHRFVDGLVLPAAFELDSAVGLAAASAVLIHQFPDGIAAASLFLAAGWHRKKTLVGILIMALLTPVGALVGLGLLGQDALVAHLIALAASTFIFIPLAELLPELRSKEHRAPVGIGFVVGYAVALLIVLIPGFVGIEV